MVAREPGESDADYELRQRDDRHRKSRCIKSSSSEEEEESQAAGSAAGSGLGAAAPAAPVERVGEEKEEKEKEKKEKETTPKPKASPKPKETSPKPAAKPKIGFYKPQQNYPGGSFQIETARSATSPGGTRRPAVTLIGLANPADARPTQTYQVRSLRGRSEVRQGTGPDPTERLELHPDPPSSSSVAKAPWNRRRGTELKKKKNRSKGFRLRSFQSRQYRNLQGQLRLARKQGIKVDRGLKKQIEEFGEGRQETFKRNQIRLRSVSRNPIGLRSVTRGNPSSSAKKAEAKKKAKAGPAV